MRLVPPPCLVLAAVSLLPLGCTSNTEERLALAKLSQSCLINSDCADQLVCAFKMCHAECATSRDCEDGARCIASERPYRVCQLEEERVCATTVDCPVPMLCGIDGECRDACSSAGECIEGQLCVGGTCADANELDENGKLTPDAGAAGEPEGAPCVYASDCSAALLCRSQACRAECKADIDCPAGQTCEETRCSIAGTAAVSCLYHSQCATDAGEFCANGACHCSCVEDRDCRNGEVCNGCGCEAGPEACSYNSDCPTTGQLCRDGLCACECKSDVDCPLSEMCDGCGCVDRGELIDGVVYGNVTINSGVQLALYEGVTKIEGNLSINYSPIASLGTVFENLKAVSGELSVLGNGNLDLATAFPLLETATKVSFIDNGGAPLISLPAFKTGGLVVSGDAVESVSLPNWTGGGVLNIYSASALANFYFPKVEEVTTFALSGLASAATLSFPKLTTVSNGFSILNDATTTGVSSLIVPLLSEINGPLQLSYTNLSDLSFLNAHESGSLEGTNLTHVFFSQNAQLSSCAVEDLKTAVSETGFLGLYNNSANLACTSCSGSVCAD